MKKYLTGILFIISSIAQAQSITVALSLNDCINCTVYIHELSNKLNNPKINFVLNKELEADSLLVNTRTGIGNFNPRTVTYSDSLYSQYAKGVRSTVSISNGGAVLYSDFLYKLDVNKFIGEYNAVFKSTHPGAATSDDLCFKGMRKGIMQIQDDGSLLVYSPQLKRYTFYDGEGNSKDIMADSLWMKKAYQAYYKDKGWQNDYNAMRDLIAESPSVLPSIKCGFKEAGKLVFLVDVSFMRVADNNDVHIFKKTFVAELDIQKNTFDNFFYVNTEALDAKNYYINSNGFTKKEGVYLFPLGSNLDPVADTKYIATYRPAKKSANALELIEILEPNIPENYLKYDLKGNFQSYTFDGNLVCLNFGEYIYDWKNKVKYPIPYTKEETESLTTIYDMVSNGGGRITTYFLYDIFDGPGNIFVLYTDMANNLKLINIDKKTGKEVKSTVVLDKNKLEAFINHQSFRLKTGKQLVYIDNNNCIAFLDL